ncbi:MAG: NAD(P)/FAD-dependent oxidoreductase [Rickettsiaceae bacterium H1]|nr:NAD(P)/FAD-dependent oxidoreductase [Rickettsiaceae bacterium H1]
MKKKTDIVIIGGGPIGIFTVFEAGMLEMSCHLIESQESIGGQCKYLYPEKPIYDIPAYPVITAEELIDKLTRQIQPFKPVFHCKRTAYEVTKQENDMFHVKLDSGEVIECRAVIIAGGCGSFEPNKPMVNNLADFEANNIHYMVENKARFAKKDIVIAGGGDSAVDWAISLVDIARKIHVVHRRNKFRCHPKSEQDLYRLAKTGKINTVIPYQLFSVEGENGNLKKVIVKTLSGDESKIIKADELLIFFGLKTNLEYITEWGLEIENKRITVNNNNYVTDIPGIYAIGDIANYPGKLKLILTGFAEAAAACYDIRKSMFPEKAFNFEYSTNKRIK